MVIPYKDKLKRQRCQIRQFLKDPEKWRKRRAADQARWRERHGTPKETAKNAYKRAEHKRELEFRFKQWKAKYKGSIGGGCSIVNQWELKDPTFIFVRGWRRQSERLNEPLVLEFKP